MLNNELSKKIVALSIDRIERYFLNQSSPIDQIDSLVKASLEKTPAKIRSRFQANIGVLRSLPLKRQMVFMGKYYNRHFVLQPPVESPAIASALRTTYEVYKGHSPDGLATTPLADYLRRHSDEYYKHVSLEMDKIYIYDEDDIGRAEVIVIGGASNGIDASELISHVRRGGEGSTLHFYGADRLAVPKWPLAADGSSNISFYCEVWELDNSDRDDIIHAASAAGGIAAAIITGLVAGGVIGGAPGAIAGAIAGALVGVINILAGLNSDDFWGTHQIDLKGPYRKPQPNPATITEERAPGGERYKIQFIRHLFDAESAPRVTYDVAVRTGDFNDADTKANVFIRIFGTLGMTGECQLGNPGRKSFVRAQTDNFTLNTDYLGNITKIEVRHDNAGDHPGWYLDHIIISDVSTNRNWTFNCDRWLARSEGDGSISVILYPI